MRPEYLSLSLALLLPVAVVVLLSFLVIVTVSGVTDSENVMFSSTPVVVFDTVSEPSPHCTLPSTPFVLRFVMFVPAASLPSVVKAMRG